MQNPWRRRVFAGKWFEIQKVLTRLVVLDAAAVFFDA
jgi:hypothetical protein